MPMTPAQMQRAMALSGLSTGLMGLGGGLMSAGMGNRGGIQQGMQSFGQSMDPMKMMQAQYMQQQMANMEAKQKQQAQSQAGMTKLTGLLGSRPGQAPGAPGPGPRPSRSLQDVLGTSEGMAAALQYDPKFAMTQALQPSLMEDVERARLMAQAKAEGMAAGTGPEKDINLVRQANAWRQAHIDQGKPDPGSLKALQWAKRHQTQEVGKTVTAADAQLFNVPMGTPVADLVGMTPPSKADLARESTLATGRAKEDVAQEGIAADMAGIIANMEGIGTAAQRGIGPAASAATFFENTLGAFAKGKTLAPETADARQALRMFNQEVKRAVINNDRFPVHEQKAIVDMLPDPDTFWQNPDVSVRDVGALRDRLRQNYQRLTGGPAPSPNIMGPVRSGGSGAKRLRYVPGQGMVPQ